MAYIIKPDYHYPTSQRYKVLYILHLICALAEIAEDHVYYIPMCWP